MENINKQDETYENIIKTLKFIGEQPISSLLNDCSFFAEYTEIIEKLYDKYGEDKVKRDLGIK